MSLFIFNCHASSKTEFNLSEGLYHELFRDEHAGYAFDRCTLLPLTRLIRIEPRESHSVARAHIEQDTHRMEQLIVVILCRYTRY